MKRVFIIHGWDGYPEEGWFPWLSSELERKGYLVQVPAMPNPAEPSIEAWVPFISKIVGDVDENSYFVGHSIGCQAILRYIERLPINKRVGGAVFVAGWFTLMNLSTDEERAIAKTWLETPVDTKKIRSHINNIVAIFSDNDTVVPIENMNLFKDRFGARTILEHGRGHFSGDDSVVKLPSVFSAILKL